jgi:CHAD domain-containing protein
MQSIQPDRETVTEGVDRLASKLLDSIGAYLVDDHPLEDNEIHEIRKSCKRLRALLRLIRQAITDHEFHEADRKVRKLAARLGQARDQAVMLDTIRHISGYYATLLAADAFTPLLDWATRQAGNGNTRAEVPHADTLRVPLEDLRTTVAAINLHTLDTGSLIEGLVDNYRRGRRALAEVEQEPDNEPVHALRRYTKYLFYQLDMVEDWDSVSISPLIDLSHRVEDALGEIHDLSVLGNVMHGTGPLQHDALRREVLGSLLETRWIRQLSGVLKLASGLYEMKPRRFREWLTERFSKP